MPEAGLAVEDTFNSRIAMILHAAWLAPEGEGIDMVRSGRA
jgi:hypothetical protein